MQITVKETKDLDYEKVVDIFYEVKFLKNPNKREIYKKTIEKAFKNSQYVVSAWDGNKLIGFARVITDGSLFATIWNMLIKPEYQKQGIGKQLIRKRLNKYPECHFFLFGDKKVVSFYQKSGFEIHRFGMYLKDGPKRCITYN